MAIVLVYKNFKYQNISSNFRDYLKSRRTKTLLVCTHLNTFYKPNPKMAMKILKQKIGNFFRTQHLRGKDNNLWICFQQDQVKLWCVCLKLRQSYNVNLGTANELTHNTVVLDFFFISYFTWVFIQVLSPVLPWSPGPECTEQFWL